jgi:hypothetical protein
MSPRPGKIKKIVPVSNICHYDRTGTDFAITKEHIYKEFFRNEEVPFVFSI